MAETPQKSVEARVKDPSIRAVSFIHSGTLAFSLAGNIIWAVRAGLLGASAFILGAPAAGLLLGASTAGLAFQAMRTWQKIKLWNGTQEMALGYEANKAQETSNQWFDKGLSQGYPLTSALAGTFLAGSVFALATVPFSVPLAIAGGAAAALAVGASQYFLAKAEVAPYKALGEQKAQQISASWFGANLVQLTTAVGGILAALGGGLRIASTVAENVIGRRAANAQADWLSSQVLQPLGPPVAVPA